MSKLTPKEKEQVESSSQPLRIKRVRKPTSIRRPPAPFESDEEEEAPPKGPTIASLSTKNKTMHKDIRSLNARLAKSLIKIRDLEDHINTLRHDLG